MSRKKVFAASLALLLTVAFGISLYLGIWSMPDIDEGVDYAVVVHSEDGSEIAEYYRERRFPVSPEEIPEKVKLAFVAAEDRRFYSHFGFDLKGIFRALRTNIRAMSVVEGGSTITQQLSKMLLKSPERSLTRKLREVLVAFRLERRYSKDEILTAYLNLAYFGERLYGIEAAARAYFNKHTRDLTVAEAALLAGLQKAPSRYSPLRNPARARERMTLVLREMRFQKHISHSEYVKALQNPLPRKLHFTRKYEAPYFTDFIRQRLAARYEDEVYRRGLRVYSTLDRDMQDAAEEAVARGVKAIERRTKKGVQAALVALDIQSGEIRAMVGGTDYSRSQFNRATMALRQPGSAFKPFVYAAAVQKGMNCDDRILDGPISIRDPDDGEWWTPKNSWNEYYGLVTLRTAIALSLNSATVRLAQKIGFGDVKDMARTCGITTDLSAHPSISLGSFEVTLLDITASYIALSTGHRITPVPYVLVRDRNGNDVEMPPPSSVEVLPPDTVEKMRILLRAPVLSGIAGLARSLNRPAYGKTGTTNDYSDAWFVGFDEDLAVGVWVGRDDHTPLGIDETGSRAALPIWTEFMKEVQ